MGAGILTARQRRAFPPRLVGPPVFVVGSPRSGTTFLGHAIGSLEGFTDAGELPSFKPRLPDLLGQRPARVAELIREAIAEVLVEAGELIDVGEPLGDAEPGVAKSRAVVHAPELAFFAHVLRRVSPGAVIIHIVRDGRDVAASLLRDGWLSASTNERDVNGWQLGAVPRFWTERSRTREFSEVSDARRAAWAWRRYTSAAIDLAAPGRDSLLVRYEDLCADPACFARGLAPVLSCSVEELTMALSGAHRGSVGRHARELDADALADVMAEAGALLGRLGYVGQPEGSNR